MSRTALAAIAMLVVTIDIAPAEPMRTWTGGEKTSVFQFGAVKLTFWQAQDNDGADIAAMQVSSPGTAPLSLVGQPGLNPVSVTYAVTKLDPANPTSEVIFSTFSGGAHCCNHLFVAERLKSGWTAFDFGMWDGDPPATVPVDVDGDKIPDIVRSDDRFLYTFAPYSDSWAPPIIVDVVNGKVDDVSKEPRYKKFYESWMVKAKAQCATHANGACAAYAGAAARAGTFGDAWTFVLANYDKSAHWDYYSRCKGRVVDGDCKGQKIAPRDFPESLRWFLQDNGYIPRS